MSDNANTDVPHFTTAAAAEASRQRPEGGAGDGLSGSRATVTIKAVLRDKQKRTIMLQTEGGTILTADSVIELIRAGEIPFVSQPNSARIYVKKFKAGGQFLTTARDSEEVNNLDNLASIKLS